MNPNELRDQLLRSEGFAEGFKNGYAMAIDWVAKKNLAEQQVKKESKNDNSDNLQAL